MSSKKNIMKHLCLGTSAVALFAFASLTASPALADCTSPASPEGGLAYFTVDDTYRLCDGNDNWVTLATGASLVTEINDLSDAYTDYTTGYNMFLGDSAGNATTTGTYNVALGQNALTSLDGGACTGSQCDNNIAIGYNALTANTTGYINVAIGPNALAANTSGYANVAIGSSALSEIVGNDQSTAIGLAAARYNSGGSNTAVGYRALMGVTGTSTGGSNTVFGFQAGDSITTGTDNILIGYNVDTPAATTSNHLNIGNLIYGDLANNYVGIDNNAPAHTLDVGADATMRMWLSTASNAAADPYSLGMSGAATNPERRFTLLSTEGTMHQALQFGDGGTTESVFAVGISNDSGTTWDPALRVRANYDVIVGPSINNQDSVLMIGSGADGSSTASSVLSLKEIGGTDAYDSGFDLYYDGNANVFNIDRVETGTVTQVLSINRGTGNLGLGDFTSDAIDSTLHLQSGEIRLDGGAANEAGCIRFNDTTDVLEYSDDCTTFTAFSAGGDADWTINGGSNYVYNTTDSIGIGTATPSAIFTIAGDGEDIHHYSYSNNAANKPDWYGYRARGTEGSPNAVQDGDQLAGWGANAYDGSTWHRTATIRSEINGTVGANSVPTDIIFENTAAGGGARSEKMRITSDGNVGIGVNAPSEVLHVVGNALIRSSNENDYTDTLNLMRDATNQYNYLFWHTGAGAPDGTTVNFGLGTDLNGGTNDLWLIRPGATGSPLGRADAVMRFDDGSTDIYMAGNVGIGNASSAYPLDIVADTSDSTALNLTSGTSPGDIAIRFDTNDSTAAIQYDSGTDGMEFRVAGTGSGNTEMFLSDSGDLAIGTTDPDRTLHVTNVNSSVTAVTPTLRLTQEATTAPGIGIGTGIEFEVETSNNNNEIGATIETVTTDVTAAAEDFDLTFNTMTSGAAASEKMRISSEGYVGIGNTSPSVALDVTGDIEYSGTITDVSDRRLKDNIEPLTKTGSLMERLDKVDTYSFTMKGDESKRTEFGVMAQELETIFPELVHTATDEMGTKSVNYVGLIAPMIEATKELNAENKSLKAEIALLKESQHATNKTLKDLSEQVALLNQVVVKDNTKQGSANFMLLALIFLLGGMTGLMALRLRRS